MEESGQFLAELARCELTSAYIQRVESECEGAVVMAIRKEFQANMKSLSNDIRMDTTTDEPGSSDYQDYMRLRRSYEETQILEEIQPVTVQPAGDENEMNNPESQLPTSPALLNPSILGVVFSYLDKKTLKDCRLVCQEWGDEATAILSKKMLKISIFFPPTHLGGHAKLASLFHVMKRSQKIPFSKYVLETEPRCPLDQPAMTEFFEIFGHSVKNLKLFIHSSSWMKEMVQKMGEFCSNMGSLHVRGYKEDTEESGAAEISRGPEIRQNVLPIPSLKSVRLSGNLDGDDCTTLFEATPNLTNINIAWDRELVIDIDHTCVIRTLRKCGRLSQITEMTLDSVKLPVLQLIQDVSIKKFEFKLLESDVKPADLARFLTSQGRTLTFLELGDNSVTESGLGSTLLVLSKMESLTEVNITFNDQGFYPASKTPAEDFPKLKRVKIEDVKMMYRIPDLVPLLTVTDLFVDLTSQVKSGRNESLIWCLGRFYPNVESLDLYRFDADDVAVAGEVWPNLKHLDLEVSWSKIGERKHTELSIGEIQLLFPAVLTFSGLKTLSVWGRKIYPA